MRLAKKIFFSLVIIFILILVAATGVLIYSQGESTIIGENELGSVTRVDYCHSDNPDVRIAVVSGMHHREKLHQWVLPIVSNIFALTHNVEIVSYQVDVTKDADEFYSGRANGESLVHDYVVSDVSNSNLSIVIIGHDHEPGYGEGYYIATPSMDNASVDLASQVTSEIGFNHYTRNKSQPSKSTSITNVDNPIVDTGTMVFVYEIPEDDNRFSALIESYHLLEATYNNLT